MRPATEIFEGSPDPLGFSKKGNRANFALFSRHASRVFLGLFPTHGEEPMEEIPLHRTGDIWHIALDPFQEGAEYAFRCEGPYEEKEGHLYSFKNWLVDPYAKAAAVSGKWGERKSKIRALSVSPPPFDWQGVEPPRLPLSDLIIYEMHVRGFTRHSSSNVRFPGSFLGIIDKIPYLKHLGVNAIELMPIFEFDEAHSKNIHPTSQKRLLNYWGYNSLLFFAPMQRFALKDPLEECKTLVRELHRNGIEIFLDVVYNHTGEGKEKDYVVQFRGIDNATYYLLDEEGRYRDFTGCGNTCNANGPAMQKLILDSLCYWIEEFRIDGFRFDLAAALTRGEDGKPMTHPPLLQAIASHPTLQKVKLIAEPWDAGGLYQLGFFSKEGRWSEWNGNYGDTVRRFLKGTDGEAGHFAAALSGSEPIYRTSKTPFSSINFITSHDGFCLRDLVTYQQKHNFENGEMNCDGNNQNNNWNCGAEGLSSDPAISALRMRQMRNFFLALFLSQGIPMLLMGDEYGHTRRGNNNPYVQDNEINWFLWRELQKNEEIAHFVASLIAFRKRHPILRRTHFLAQGDIDWHGHLPFQPNWGIESRFVAFALKGSTSLYAAFNAHFQPATVTLPPGSWRSLVQTALDWDRHFLNAEATAPLVPSQIQLPPYSALLART